MSDQPDPSIEIIDPLNVTGMPNETPNAPDPDGEQPATTEVRQNPAADTQVNPDPIGTGTSTS